MTQEELATLERDSEHFVATHSGPAARLITNLLAELRLAKMTGDGTWPDAWQLVIGGDLRRALRAMKGRGV